MSAGLDVNQAEQGRNHSKVYSKLKAVIFVSLPVETEPASE
jgi:hypothetical protein